MQACVVPHFAAVRGSGRALATLPSDGKSSPPRSPGVDFLKATLELLGFPGKSGQLLLSEGKVGKEHKDIEIQNSWR